MSTLGSRLRQAREAAKLSQSALARRIGVSPQAIQHIEAEKSVTSRYVVQLAGSLGVSASWLATGEEQSIERQGKRFALPKHEDQQSRHLRLHRLDELNNIKPDKLIFPEKEGRYLRDRIPVFTAKPYRFAELPELTVRQEFDQLKSWISCNSGHLSKDEIGQIAEYQFYVIPDRNPDEFTPRPYYLAGQVEAYALFLEIPPDLTNRVGNVQMSHISPYKLPEYCDLVAVWHESNTFIIGEFWRSGAHHVELRHFASEQRHDKWCEEHGWATDPADRPETGLRLPLEGVRAIHTIVGAEFALPQSSKIGRQLGREFAG